MAAMNAMSMTSSAVTPMNGFQSTPTVSMSRLIEFAIQKTYHELTVLADLLPRKTDMERKIEIVQFASRTRQLFVRLLALVKWAGSASKVDKCANIVQFLDRQSDLFIETADILAKASRETLVSARLPSFQLPSAVEVLTLGTYSRLPAIIRDRIVPPDPISNVDRKTTLLRLNHIIQQRLVSTALPLQMKSFKIEFGRVVFHVDHEFELSITLMGDIPSLPWRVLNIKILVEDKETGGGKDLVHPMQVMYLLHLVQSRLTDNSNPLVDAYNTLHSFCLSLQLEVLHAQAIRLCFERLDDFIRIEGYSPGNCLVLSYWREHKDDKGFKLCVQIDSIHPSRPLQVIHCPELEMKDESLKSDYFSIEKKLLQTTYERSKQKLSQLRKELDELNVGKSVISGAPAVLHISFLQPCMISERLLISVDSLTGYYLVHIPQFEDCSIVEEIQTVINKNIAKVVPLFRQLKIWLTRERCKKTVESLPVYVMENLPFHPTYSHPFLAIKSQKLFYRFGKNYNNCLVTVFNENESNDEIEIYYYLLYLSQTTGTGSDSNNQFDIEIPKLYVQINKALKLDISNILRETFSSEDNCDKNGKRKLCTNNLCEPNKTVRTATTGYYIPQLAHVVSFCEEKLAYSLLSLELQKRSICHQVLQDSDGYTHYIDIVKFSPANQQNNSDNYFDKLQTDTLSAIIRLHGKGSKMWNILLAFCNPPVQTLSAKEQGSRRILTLPYDYNSGSQTQITKMVDELLNDWTAIARLYDIIKKFATSLQTTNQLTTSFDIKSFTYKKIIIGYGIYKTYIVTIYWKTTEKRFQLFFGCIGSAPSDSNPHVIISSQLQHEFNQHLSIIQLIQILNYTINPLLTIQSLSGIPLLGVINSRPQLPVQSFCAIPQSSTHIRIVYRNIYCLDITINSDNTIAIRDGALSLFDKMKVMEELIPIQGLKAFLSKFVDKTTQMRRLSQTEDDNPPSPIESVESYLYSTTQIKASNSPSKNINDGNLNTSARQLSHTIASSAHGSNPHTPSSPHTSILSQSAYVSSPGAFPMTSPPSHGIQTHGIQTLSSNQVVPSPSMPVPDQSPANIFNVNSPMNPLHAPSPSFLAAPSPSASNQFHSQSPVSQYHATNTPQTGIENSIGSPFTTPNMPASNISMPSPAPNVWPGSPSLPRPSPRSIGPSQSPGISQVYHMSNIASPQSIGGPQHLNTMHSNITSALIPSNRMLPQRPWAAAIPTLLTHQGFDIMCKPNANMDNMSMPAINNNVYYLLSQLERFLGCVYVRRNIQRAVTQDEKFNFIMTPEPGVIQFKNDTMVFKLSLDTISMQSLHLKIAPLSDVSHTWSRDDLEILQQFFENKVVCAPFKPNAFLTYSRILNAPMKILKDCIQLMRLELSPDRSLKWTLHWCLTIPPASATIGLPGMSACLMVKNKMLIFIQLTRIPMAGHNLNAEPFSIIVPFVYDINTHSIQVAGFGRDSQYSQSSVLNVINNMLKRFADYGATDGLLYLAIKDIMANLNVP
ncbi:mediator of RNA polymerase II transcription subunit 14-like [Oppia nitens]|uniref:mediator of RNA polymerase II transcription subunit 14-like n=1 Tax=Oppia nitens TaxID=1686743 RepID=UPI0023DAD87B|nr:mediator of RNA polymerase II transcription subunit 14-like [Oppia nitens]